MMNILVLMIIFKDGASTTFLVLYLKIMAQKRKIIYFLLNLSRKVMKNIKFYAFGPFCVINCKKYGSFE